MSVYIILDIDVHDPVRYEEYKVLAAPSLAPYGGRYLVRGGAVETLEGAWQPKRVVVLEFDDVERARAWLNSEEYRPARAIRQAVATTQSILVPGVA
jgi:uncharacterized protein (DUF1330 family)